MNRCIIDASVAVKWFFREEELTEQALDLLNSGTGFVVPDYFYLEMYSVFAKLVRKRFLLPDDARRMQRALNALPVDVLEVKRYRDLALELSIERNIGFYDCLYVIPASISEIPLVTADRRLYRAFKSTKLSSCVCWLGDYS